MLLAKADAKKGAQFAKVCQTCHNFEKGAGAKIGPPLWGVVGRPIASIPGFAYSDLLKGVGGNWTYEALNVMVSNPKKEASGTKMTFPGRRTHRGGLIFWPIFRPCPTRRSRSRSKGRPAQRLAAANFRALLKRKGRSKSSQ